MTPSFGESMHNHARHTRRKTEMHAPMLQNSVSAAARHVDPTRPHAYNRYVPRFLASARPPACHVGVEKEPSILSLIERMIQRG